MKWKIFDFKTWDNFFSSYTNKITLSIALKSEIIWVKKHLLWAKRFHCWINTIFWICKFNKSEKWTNYLFNMKKHLHRNLDIFPSYLINATVATENQMLYICLRHCCRGLGFYGEWYILLFFYIFGFGNTSKFLMQFLHNKIFP